MWRLELRWLPSTKKHFVKTQLVYNNMFIYCAYIYVTGAVVDSICLQFSLDYTELEGFIVKMSVNSVFQCVSSLQCYNSWQKTAYQETRPSV